MTINNVRTQKEKKKKKEKKSEEDVVLIKRKHFISHQGFDREGLC